MKNDEFVVIKELITEEYFPKLIDLSKEFFFEYENNDKDFFEIDSINEIDIKQYFRNFIENNDGKAKAYIAIINEQVVGYITVYIKNQPNYWVLKEVGDISGLMVNKKFRQKGIGTKLVMKAKEYFKERGIKYYTVFTSINNVNGISLYKNFGFKELYTTLYGKTE
jgi:ribosomal protein S18 acetylase RimI-like enzyme